MIGKCLRVPIAFLLTITMFSCYNANELTTEEKYAVDTIFNAQLHTYRNYVDSLCLAEKDTLYAQTVDSLKKEGLKEIELLLMKNHLAE